MPIQALMQALAKRYGKTAARRKWIWIACTGLANGIVLGGAGWVIGSLIGFKLLGILESIGIMILGCVLGFHSAYRHAKTMGFSIRGWPGDQP